MANEWEDLVRRYANGRSICNCGNAYYSEGGTYWKTGSTETFHDGQYCKDGCSANCCTVKDDVAKRALAELSQMAAERNQLLAKVGRLARSCGEK